MNNLFLLIFGGLLVILVIIFVSNWIYLKNIPDDEKKNHCGSCGGRLK